MIDSRGIHIFRVTLFADFLDARRKLPVPVVPAGGLIVRGWIEMRRAAALGSQDHEADGAGGEAEAVLERQDVSRGDRVGGHQRWMYPYEHRQPVGRRGGSRLVEACITRRAVGNI